MPRGPIVITGCSTGIGRETALRLACAGHRVFAGVRREADAEALRAECVAGLEPVLLEVTDAASIEAAAKQVASALGEAGLAGLVNNAGITTGGPLEYVDLDELRRVLEVNTIAPVAVTQAFLPLLRRARGRVVLVTSIGGRIATPIIAPYSASKFALEALGDALRVELAPWGMHVAIVEPGAIATAIFGKGRSLAEQLMPSLSEEGKRRYAGMIRAVLDAFNAMEARANPPERAARAIEHALTAARPRTRYLVGGDARAQAWIARLPDRARDRVLALLLKLPGSREVGE